MLEGQEMIDAMEALIDWLNGQGIDADEAVPLLGNTLVAIIHGVAKAHHRDFDATFEIAMQAIRDVKETQK
jgi:hypothetical protein